MPDYFGNPLPDDAWANANRAGWSGATGAISGANSWSDFFTRGAYGFNQGKDKYLSDYLAEEARRRREEEAQRERDRREEELQRLVEQRNRAEAADEEFGGWARSSVSDPFVTAPYPPSGAFANPRDEGNFLLKRQGEEREYGEDQEVQRRFRDILGEDYTGDLVTDRASVKNILEGGEEGSGFTPWQSYQMGRNSYLDERHDTERGETLEESERDEEEARRVRAYQAAVADQEDLDDWTEGHRGEPLFDPVAPGEPMRSREPAPIRSNALRDAGIAPGIPVAGAPADGFSLPAGSSSGQPSVRVDENPRVVTPAQTAKLLNDMGIPPVVLRSDPKIQELMQKYQAAVASGAPRAELDKALQQALMRAGYISGAR